MLSLSTIIPCKNEARYIGNCIEALLHQIDTKGKNEIIVVDNGSTDGTIDILKNFGSRIRYFICPNLNISELRNYGAKNSNGDLIAFIDADVEVDKLWLKSILNYYYVLQKNRKEDEKYVITGSTCLIPEDATWVEKIWFEQIIFRDQKNTKYINSANIIIHKELFNKIGGFNAKFLTGEDENLCYQAILLKGKIIKNNDIKAIHYRYPKDIESFFKRMRWHGLGLEKYFKKPWQSKPLVLSIYNVISLIIWICMILLYKKIIIVTIIFIILQILPVLLFALYRYSGKMHEIFLLTFLYFIFGWSKVFAVYDILNKRYFNKTRY